MERMTISEALDERDFLAEKIRKDIRSLNVITVKRKKDPRTKSGLEVDKFIADGKALYQSIQDNIDRYKRINVAIVLSNATTKIKLRTSGKEISVAEAIALKKMISTGEDFDTMLYKKLQDQNDKAIAQYDQLNMELERQRRSFTETLLQNGNTDKLTEDQLKSIDTVTESAVPEIIDAVATESTSLSDIVDKMYDENNSIVKEINSAIKISNAVTEIEF